METNFKPESLSFNKTDHGSRLPESTLYLKANSNLALVYSCGYWWLGHKDRIDKEDPSFLFQFIPDDPEIMEKLLIHYLELEKTPNFYF